LNLLNSRYFLLNRESDIVLDMESFLTSRIGDTSTVTLGDRRRRGTVQRRPTTKTILWLLRVTDILSLNFIFKAVKKRRIK
jgi:hypothetical protein